MRGQQHVHPTIGGGVHASVHTAKATDHQGSRRLSQAEVDIVLVVQ